MLLLLHVDHAVVRHGLHRQLLVLHSQRGVPVGREDVRGRGDQSWVLAVHAVRGVGLVVR